MGRLHLEIEQVPKDGNAFRVWDSDEAAHISLREGTQYRLTASSAAKDLSLIVGDEFI